MDPYHLLNLKLQEFVDDLLASYPGVTDIRVMKTMLNLTVAMDIKLPQDMFNRCVVIPYEQQILAKDECFFLEEAYDPQYADINIIEKLKGIWKTLPAEDKEIVWKYFQVLLVLNRRCLRSNQ